eukprot:CAMPEP_0176480756 /NCGR_PEP_ID=MMETSP0200_2-20121128/2449_1 /TAXON_ID=947934 /ORGANISM="Chaetoceros sp., Strain GSL56" /LENGTH=615 /DNA_ID=CAMNT_0017876901 /DNA_START=2368 /DNA_END=4215 /DNA_ORIENTATION=-
MQTPITHEKYAATYAVGEEHSRLQSAAQYFGLQNTRTPASASNNNGGRHMHSRSILKFGSTVWDNVGLLFSDSTLEAARMHSVGVMAQEERIAGDGTLHLLSISRRKKGFTAPTTTTTTTTTDLMDLFHRKPIEALEYEVRETGDEEYEDVIIDSVEGGSITAAIFGIVKGTVGPAVLYLPRGFAMSGYAVAVPSMIIATATYLYSATRLLQCWKVESDKVKLFSQKLEEIRELLDPPSSQNTKNLELSHGYGSISSTETTTKDESSMMQSPKTLLTYPELSRRAFGQASALISGGIAAMQFGVCLTYLIFVPQNLYESTKSLFGLEVPRHFFLLGMLSIETPLVWIRDIRKLTPMNILATMLIAFGLASVLFIALFGRSDVTQLSSSSRLIEDIVHLPASSPTWFLFIGTSFFCFEGAITLIVPLQEAVYKKQDRERFPSINRRVTTSIVTFYIFFAIICWASFGDSVQTALTASLPKSVLSTIVQFAYSIAVIFTFPLQAFPALEVVCHTTETKVGTYESRTILKRNMLASTIICFLGLIAVIAIDYLGNVVSLLGSLVGIPIALVYPPLMHNQLVPSSLTTRFLNYTLSGVGVIATIVASYTTIKCWNEGAG